MFFHRSESRSETKLTFIEWESITKHYGGYVWPLDVFQVLEFSNRHDDVVVRASASQSINLGLIFQVELHQKNSMIWYSHDKP